VKELRVEDVHTYYGQSHVLQGLSLRAARGAVTGIVGRNGAGKTTLVRSIAGFTPPRSGRIVLDGEEVQGRRAEDIARQGIGLVPQGRRIFPSLTVEEHLRVAASTNERKDWTLENVYNMFPALEERPHHLGSQLSGGEQQMLAIARALMTNPQVLVMDEPSEGLAPLVVKELDRRIAELAETGLTIVLVEQNLPLVLSRTEHVYVVSKGRVVLECEPNELKEDHDKRRTYLGV
jgi:branched-chain amino acid transport system ATP-binding protein